MRLTVPFALASGCSPRPTPADDSSRQADDTATVLDPCVVPPAPSDYVNDEFATTDCTFAGFPAPAEQMASAMLSWPQMRMQYAAIVNAEPVPNTVMYVEWFEERGADPYPSESILLKEGWADAPVNVFVVDCRTKVWADCVYYFSTSGRAYYSDGGRCANWKESRLVGFIDQVVLRQADVVVDKGTSEWVEGGDTWCIDRYDFDVYLDAL